ncbi:HEAT repeat domain-containing protein [Conyzicola sp.]|uniref:HEAT repeat domain-containing protein n=1 Tax=Conyzicola sp. TaxID=1969404 RepID=UPI0039891E9F
MTSPDQPGPADRLRAALLDDSSSARLQSALAAGTYPDARFVPVLVDRSGIEPDFFVRDMLTWALTRHSSADTVPRLLYEVGAELPQARSQALHTLSKIGDPRGWSAITPEILRDPDDEVATTAWRTASGLVPEGQGAALAAELCTQLGRGGLVTQRSLSRSIAALGDVAIAPLQASAADGSRDIRIHALATERLLHDPEEGFDAAYAEARGQIG